MSRNKHNKPVSPLYAVALLWLAWALILPLYALLHYLPLIIVSVVLYKKVFKKAMAKMQTETTEKTEQQVKNQPVKEQPAQPVAEEKTTGNPEVDKLIKERALTVSELKRLKQNITNEKIRGQIDDLEYVSSKIFDHVIAHPDKVPQISKFLNYYLPTTMKLLNTYDRMGSQGVEGENITGTMKKVEETLDMVVTAFHKQLDTLFAGEALDISADITVMENLMKTEGLAQDDMNSINLTLSER